MVGRAAPNPTLVRLAVSAVLLVLLAVVVLGMLLRYQPLRQVGELEPGSDMQVVTVEEFEESGAHILRYVHGDEVTYAFTLRNTGPLSVTVLRLELGEDRKRRLLQPVRVGLPAGASAEQTQAFWPFRLGAGEQQRIVVTARFDNCEYYTERALEVLDRQAVDFRVAGIQRGAVIRFDRPLLVRSPTIQRCHDRTMDRAQNRRTDP